MDKQQDFFTHALIKLREKGYTVYDLGAPGESATYPYILMGDMQQIDSPRTKTREFFNLYPTFHVYQNKATERGTLSEIAKDIKRVCYAYAEDHHALIHGISERIITDNTTSVPLLHCIVEPTFEL